MVIARRFSPNPFYEGAGVLILTDTDTGRSQHMAVWPPMTRTQWLARMRVHLRRLREPEPVWDVDPNRIRFVPTREADDADFWA